MSKSFLTGSDLLKAVERVCSDIGNGDALLVVSYWSGGAANRLVNLSKGQLRVVLDVAAGGTSPADLKYLMDQLGDNVRVYDDLHAKVYSGIDHAVIGSANATSPGLQLQDSDRVEAAALLEGSDARDVRNWAEGIFQSASIANDQHLQTAKQRFKRISLAKAEATVSGNDGMDAFLTLLETYSEIPLIVTNEEIDNVALRDKEFSDQEGGEKFDEKKWVEFEFNLDESVYNRPCLHLHVGGGGAVYAGLVLPVERRRDDQVFTFATRVSWAAFPGFMTSGVGQVRVKKILPDYGADAVVRKIVLAIESFVAEDKNKGIKVSELIDKLSKF